ncbi:MAG TPA: hypothetical protein VN809_08525 [Telmatospirillum sp.]|nr:hypothetical protein [Telmatospirillum sp.]
MPPSFFDDGGARRIVFQIWDWQDDRRYTVHLHISRQREQGWDSRHFVGCYRAVPTHEMVALASEAGFERVRVHSPDETGYYQPIITAIRPLS